MDFSDKMLNTGVLIKRLHENFLKGKNRYTIHADWWAISDTVAIFNMVSDGYLLLDGRTISFTEKGQDIITALYAEKVAVKNDHLFAHLEKEANRILHAFQ